MVDVTAAYAKGRVESADTPTEAEPEKWVPYSIKVHNEGGTGIFGYAVWLYSGPSPIKVRVAGEEHDLPVGQALIRYYVEPKPNCTRLEEAGQIQYMEEGEYIIELAAVHREGEEWIADDYREFTVTVEKAVPPPWWEEIIKWWEELPTWQKALVVAGVAVGAGSGAYVIAKRRR